jgi:hypothetical protein
MVTQADLERNYTDEVEAFYGDRLRKLDAIAGQWPIRVAFSKIRDTATHNPGARQCHLLCWLEKDAGIHCGQAVYVLATGQTLYCVRPDGIKQGIKTHIAQCHMEVIENGGHADAETASRH